MKVEIEGVTVNAEVASTPEELYRGLSEKDTLGEYEGMFFDWSLERQHGLVMRDMSFPIDAIFLNRAGEVVHTSTLKEDGSQATAHSKYALEVSEGFCDTHNIDVGDTASFELETHNVSKQVGQDEEWRYEEGPRGADRWVNERGDVRYRPPGEEGEDESELGYDLADSEIGNIGATVKPGEYRRDFQSPDEAMEALSEFDSIEEEYPYDSWTPPNPEDWTQGSYVRVQDDMFQLEGDGDEGQLGVIIQSEDPPVLMTEEGELKQIDQTDIDNTGEGDSAYVLATWDDPANAVATGEKEWSDFFDEAIPDNVPETEREDQEEESEEDETPYWASEKPLSDVTQSSVPERGVNTDDLYFYDGQLTGLDLNDELSGDIEVYGTTDLEGDSLGESYTVNYSAVDDVLCRAKRPTDVTEGEVQYIDFKEESEYEDGWYQVQDDNIQIDEDDRNSIGYRMWSEEHGEVEASVLEVRDEANAVHLPIEDSYTNPIESTPEPSGEKDPDTWSIDWSSQSEEKTGDALPMAQKKLLIREWEEAIDNPEATDSVSTTVRDVKDSTFNTQGQKYDKLIQAVMDVEGEPRSNGFEEADDPTEDEIEAMRLLQEASQKYFEENFGDDTEIYRALADYSHERLLPQIRDTILSDETLAEKEVELEDNPAGIWTTDENAANVFTAIGGTSKSLVIKDSASKEDVFNMPDAIYPYEQRQEISSMDSDWDESEINVPSNGKQLQPSQISVVQAFEFGEERDVAPLEDVIDDPQSVVESGNPGAISSFLRTLQRLGDEDLYTAYRETIEANDAITESDGWDVIETQIQSFEYNPSGSFFSSKSTKQDNELITIDLTSEADSNWLHTDEEENEGYESDFEEKLHSAAVSAVESNLSNEQDSGSRSHIKRELSKHAISILKDETPEGVPDNSEYVPPDYEPEEDERVVVSDYGGRYVVSDEESQSNETTEPEITGDELTEFAMSRMEYGEITSQVREDNEQRDEIIDEMTEAVATGLDADVAVESVRTAIDQQSSFSEIYSPEEVIGRFASMNHPADTEAGERLNQRMHMLSENPEEFPDVAYGHDDDPFDNDAPELEAELKDRITPDNYLDMTSHYRRGNETISLLGEAVEDSVDPVDAVMALGASYDDAQLEVMDLSDVNSKISLHKVEPETASEAEVVQEFRKLKQDPENYPRELSDTERSVMDSLESVVDEEDSRYNNVNELTWSSLRYNDTGFRERVADIIEDGGDVSEVTEKIDKYVGGDNRSSFYSNLSSELGTTETELGDTDYLLGNNGYSEAYEILQERLGEEDIRTWNRASMEWFGEVYGEQTAPLFKIAEEKTGNEQVPDEDVFDVLGQPESPEREVHEEVVEHSQEVIKEVYGDTVTCYRGLSPEGDPSDAGSTDISRQIEQAAENGESFDFPHRTLESWSVNPIHARLFSGVNEDEEDGIIIEAEIDTDRVIAASGSGALSRNEEELVIAHEQSREYEPSQVLTAEEIRNGKDAALLLENTQEFVDERMTEQSEKSVNKREIDVSIEELPPVNWLRNVHIEDSPREKILTQAVSVVKDATPEGVPDNSEYVPPDYEPGEGERIVVSDYGGNYVVSEGESGRDEQPEEVKPDWFEDDVAQYGQLEEMPTEGDYLNIGGEIKQIDVREGNTVSTPAKYEWSEPEEYRFIDGVATSKTDGVGDQDAVIFDGETSYLEFSDDSELEDGWYNSKDGDVGQSTVVVESESGEKSEIPRVSPEAKYTPASSERLTHSMGTPWEKYQGQEYPTDARITDTLQYESEIGEIDSLSDRQTDAVANGLAKADDWDLIDDLDKITASDSLRAVAGYKPGLNLMVFNPDSFTDEKYEEIEEGKYATESLEDTVIHESVHVKHAKKMKDDPDIDFSTLAQELVNDRLETGERDMIREFVSDYAGVNAFEVVAEVGVKILKGEEVRDEAMYLYEKYYGPEL